MSQRAPIYFLLVALGCLLWTSAGIAKGWTSEPLADKWVQKLEATPADPRPDELSANAHFAISDERRHDLFADGIKDKGGALIGVGPEQNYLLAGWAKPEILILMDFDQFVVDLHDIYRLVFLEAKTPEEFQAIWRGKGSISVDELIRREVKDADKQAALLKVSKRSRKLVSSKIRALEKYARKFRYEYFLQNADMYDGIRALYQQNRVFAVRGDLTASQTLKSLSATLREMKVPVRVLYLSNAEKYFPWVEGYRDNMRALPFDAETAIIRTAGWGESTAAEDDPLYMYLIQSGDNFRAWINTKIKNWSPMLSRRGRAIDKGFYRIETLPGK